MLNESLAAAYNRILSRELLPALGCTEPIAIAYAAAVAAEYGGRSPRQVIVSASGNIIKNAQSVVVPNTDGLKGIEAAALTGLAAGKAADKLEVIAHVSPEQRRLIQDWLAQGLCRVELADSDCELDISVRLLTEQDDVRVRIAGEHTHIALIEKNGQRLAGDGATEAGPEDEDYRLLSVADIVDFADNCDLEPLLPLLERQIEYNSAIADEGLTHSWGANVGRTILDGYGDGVAVRAKARAAAGSDARMGGCDMPVVIVCGSGNQGMTASLPVIEYAKELGVSRDKLLRALVLSDLIAIHEKRGIGRLSAFCGAVSAGCAAGAAVAYLHGGGRSLIDHTIVNCLAVSSGIVCDGAKPSCAAKIALSVEAGLLGYLMAAAGQEFKGGEGIVRKGVENTIDNVSRLGRVGMKGADAEILKMMTEGK